MLLLHRIFQASDNPQRNGRKSSLTFRRLQILHFRVSGNHPIHRWLRLVNRRLPKRRIFLDQFVWIFDAIRQTHHFQFHANFLCQIDCPLRRVNSRSITIKRQANPPRQSTKRFQMLCRHCRSRGRNHVFDARLMTANYIQISLNNHRYIAFSNRFFGLMQTKNMSRFIE